MPNPVKSLATDLGLPVYQPTSLREAESATPLQGFAPDVLIVAAYGLLLPEHVLNIPTHGCMPHFCPAGVAQHPLNGPSWQAIRKQA